MFWKFSRLFYLWLTQQSHFFSEVLLLANLSCFSDIFFFLTLWVLERKFGEMWIPVQRFVMWIYVTAALIRSSYSCLWVYECVWERERGRGKQGWYFYVCLFEALFICMLSIVLKLRSEIFHLFFSPSRISRVYFPSLPITGCAHK